MVAHPPAMGQQEEREVRTVVGTLASRKSLVKVSNLTSSFEKVVKTLVERMELLTEKVGVIESRTREALEAVNLKVDTLAHNIQGFGDSAQKMENERVALDEYRKKLEALEEERQKRLKEDEASLTEEEKALLVKEEPPPEEEARERNEAARERWKWAFSQIKFKMMMQRMDLKGIKVGVTRSLGHRLEQVETNLDTIFYKLGDLVGGKSVVGDELRTVDRRLDRLSALMDLCRKGQADTTKWRKTQETEMARVEGQLDGVSDVVGTLKQAYDAKGDPEILLKNALTALDGLAIDAREASVKVPIRDSELAPYLKAFAHDLLGPDGALQSLKSLADRPLIRRRQAVERVAWTVFQLVHRREYYSNDAPDDSFDDDVTLKDVVRRDGSDTFERDLHSAHSQLLEVLRDLTNAGAVSLRTRRLETRLAGIDAKQLESKLSNLTAATEKATSAAHTAASLDQVEKACLDILRRRDKGHTALEVYEGLRDARETLGALETSITGLAKTADVTLSLDLVNRQVGHLRNASIHRDDFHKALSLKADKNEMDKLSKILQTFTDADPVLASKETQPKFRCLSCNSTLKVPPTVVPSSKRSLSTAAFEALVPADDMHRRLAASSSGVLFPKKDNALPCVTPAQAYSENAARPRTAVPLGCGDAGENRPVVPAPILPGGCHNNLGLHSRYPPLSRALEANIKHAFASSDQRQRPATSHYPPGGGGSSSSP